MLACIGYLSNPQSFKSKTTTNSQPSNIVINSHSTSQIEDSSSEVKNSTNEVKDTTNAKTDSAAKPTSSAPANAKYKKGDIVKFSWPYDGGEYYGVVYDGLPKYVDYKEYLADVQCYVTEENRKFKIINNGTAFLRAENALPDSFKPIWYMVEDMDGDCGVGYVYENALESAK